MNPPTVPPSETTSDRAEIESVIRGYIEGWYAGDVDEMDRVLHADLVKRIRRGDDPDTLRMVTKSRMIELTADGGGDAADPEMEISIYDVSNEIATARVVSPEYVDYLHLVETSTGWKIANVLFHNRPE